MPGKTVGLRVCRSHKTEALLRTVYFPCMSWMDELESPIRDLQERRQAWAEFRKMADPVIRQKLAVFWEGVVMTVAEQDSLWQDRRSQLPADAPQGILTRRTNGFRYCARRCIDAVLNEDGVGLLVYKSYRHEFASPGECPNPPLQLGTGDSSWVPVRASVYLANLGPGDWFVKGAADLSQQPALVVKVEATHYGERGLPSSRDFAEACFKHAFGLSDPFRTFIPAAPPSP